MRPRSQVSVTGLVLAAGASTRLGQPKQLLAFRGSTLLDHVLATARACEFDQLVCVVGGASQAVRAVVDFTGVEVVENDGFRDGCSSSIAAALRTVDPGTEIVVLMLGDQPGVVVDSVRAVVEAAREGAIALCAYENGRGHPMAFARSMFGELAALHGDKAVWRLLHRFDRQIVEVAVPGPVPRDIDTWDDYEAVLPA